MNILVLSLFCAILTGCVIAGTPIVAALSAGLVLFLIYGALQGFSTRDLVGMCWAGIRSAGNILLAFLLIGILTALWRASGCIPAIVTYVSGLIHPGVFILLTFLANALVSVLTGTAFGTAATMGVICMSIAGSLGLPVFWTGSAVLSGVFVGDRCSPVSTSALLVSALTRSNLYTNIKNMVRTAAVPFALTCLIYALAGMTLSGTGGGSEVADLFSREFNISALCLLPAVSILVLALFRTDVKLNMLISIVIAYAMALSMQQVGFGESLQIMLTGYRPESAELAGIIDGGGITSMLRVAAIVCIASCYSGIFNKTGMLDFLRAKITLAAGKHGNYRTMLPVAVFASAIACNQTLAIMLTHQLCSGMDLQPDTEAIYLEDTAVIVAPLIPWSIAGTVPLASAGAPVICILGACYLYLLPLWQFIRRRPHRIVAGAAAGV